MNLKSNTIVGIKKCKMSNQTEELSHKQWLTIWLHHKVNRRDRIKKKVHLNKHYTRTILTFPFKNISSMS